MVAEWNCYVFQIANDFILVEKLKNVGSIATKSQDTDVEGFSFISSLIH